VTNRRVGSPIISETANPAATNETYIGGGIFVPRSWQNMLIVPATLPGQRWEIGAKQIFQERIEICSA
jgi:hypothetical protein